MKEFKEKKKVQDGILARKEDSNKPRVCPSCHSKLKINVNNFKVYCSSCGYIEPCHLRKITISQINCFSCPYSPSFKDDLALKDAKKKYFAKRKNQYDVLPLGIVKTLTQENLDFPKLKGKCYQSWKPEATKGKRFTVD